MSNGNIYIYIYLPYARQCSFQRWPLHSRPNHVLPFNQLLREAQVEALRCLFSVVEACLVCVCVFPHAAETVNVFGVLGCQTYSTRMMVFYLQKSVEHGQRLTAMPVAQSLSSKPPAPLHGILGIQPHRTDTCFILWYSHCRQLNRRPSIYRKHWQSTVAYKSLQLNGCRYYNNTRLTTVNFRKRWLQETLSRWATCSEMWRHGGRSVHARQGSNGSREAEALT